MKYPLLFGTMAVAWLLIAVLRGGWWWIAAWPALSFALVACAYGGAGVGVFGKQPDGRMAWWALILLLPFLLMTWSVWHLQHLFDRNRRCQIQPGVWIGRRPLLGDLPGDVQLIVDCTAEFRLAPGISPDRQYVNLPMLDHSVPTLAAFGQLIESLSTRPETMYIHCAQGHGRSALVAAAVLLARGDATSIDGAMEQIRCVRSRVKLGVTQRALLEAWWSQAQSRRTTREVA
jgi:protein-tyrosine phosphatase